MSGEGDMFRVRMPTSEVLETHLRDVTSGQLESRPGAQELAVILPM